jgi:hypothetical protein
MDVVFPHPCGTARGFDPLRDRVGRRSLGSSAPMYQVTATKAPTTITRLVGLE